MVMTTQNAEFSTQQKLETQRLLSFGVKIGAGLAKAWSALTGSSGRLLDLNQVKTNCTVVDYCFIGVHRVSLSQIRGSASTGRCHDFDANFRPLRDHNESRWQGVSNARRRGAKLPPVSLVQVGDIYFVEDGHHRISVAKARDEQTIEAEITVWQVATQPITPQTNKHFGFTM
jgi:hypothetical protein